MSRGRIVLPGTGRITLVLLVVVPAAMAYPWHETTERWILGIAVAVVIVLLAWWRGLHVTNIVRRRLGLLGGRARREPGAHTLLEQSAPTRAPPRSCGCCTIATTPSPRICHCHCSRNTLTVTGSDATPCG